MFCAASRITSTVACDMDLTKYPMDEQECRLDLESCKSSNTLFVVLIAWLLTIRYCKYTTVYSQTATLPKTSCITGRKASNTSMGSTNWSSPSSPSLIIDSTLKLWTSNLVSIHVGFFPSWLPKMWVSDNMQGRQNGPESLSHVSQLFYAFCTSFSCFFLFSIWVSVCFVHCRLFLKKDVFFVLLSCILASILRNEGIDQLRLAVERRRRFRNII